MRERVLRSSKLFPCSNSKPLPQGRLDYCAIVLTAILVAIVSGCSRGFPSISTTPSGLLTFAPSLQSANGLSASTTSPATKGNSLTAPVAGGPPTSTGSVLTGGAIAGTPAIPQTLELESKVRSLDDANKQLTSQLAQAQQQIQLYKDRSDLMQRQLADVSSQLQTRIAANSLAATPPPPAVIPPTSSPSSGREFGSSSSRRSGARLTANVSRTLESDPLRELGYDVETASDGLRLRIPSDQLFQPGSAQLTPSGTGLLDRIADILKSNYSDRRIAIEGYTDSAPLYGGSYSTSHQLTSAQTDTILEQWTRRNQLPAAQFVTLAHGSNHPISDNQSPAGRAANRRIEVVVQAEGSR